MWLRVSAIIFQLFKLIMLQKCVLTILESNWNQRLEHEKTKLNICHYLLTSSTQLQNRSFHVVERTRTSTKCQKMKNARAKRAKILFFIVKYANLWGSCRRRRRGCLSSLLLNPKTLSSFFLLFFFCIEEAAFLRNFLVLSGHWKIKDKVWQIKEKQAFCTCCTDCSCTTNEEARAFLLFTELSSFSFFK